MRIVFELPPTVAVAVVTTTVPVGDDGLGDGAAGLVEVGAELGELVLVLVDVAVEELPQAAIVRGRTRPARAIVEDLRTGTISGCGSRLSR